MRIHLKINASNVIIPYDHQHLLTGAIHKWLGINDEHGNISLYSFSRLENGKAISDGLLFEQGTSFFFSSYKPDLIKKMIAGIQYNPSLFNGLTISDIVIQEDPDLSNRKLFHVASPIFIKRRIEERIEHILYNNKYANSCLEETLVSKMKKIGLIDKTLSIQFEANYPNSRTKKITYKGVQNRANWCPVIIEGKPETKLFAWNVGLGNSTGIGFGAIK